MTNDDRFDEFLRRAAQQYHTPPATPREAMWARIDAERQRRRHATPAAPARLTRWWAVGLGLVAALLIGIFIGRASLLRTPGARSPSATTAPSIAATPEPGTSTAMPDSSATPSGTVQSAPSASRLDRAPAPRPTPSSRTLAARDATPHAPRRDATGARTYEAATIEHLTRVEAMLTAFRAESKSGRVDGQITAWAGDLLSTTRLLLDAPAATKDPRLAKLLGDLEVVLVQITQLHPQQRTRPDELQLIDQAVEDHEMMLRLRATIPAGPLPAGS